MSLLRRIAVLAGPTALLVATAHVGPALAQETATAPVAPVESTAQIERGIAAYKANYCGACHSLQAVGSRGTFGPTHQGMTATAAERLADPAYSGTAETPEAYIRESILDPTAYLVPGFAMTPHAMPSFAHLTTGDLDALVALLLAQ